jgi:hypothetical protein
MLTVYFGPIVHADYSECIRSSEHKLVKLVDRLAISSSPAARVTSARSGRKEARASSPVSGVEQDCRRGHDNAKVVPIGDR